jgi:hypothetical protein
MRIRKPKPLKFKRYVRIIGVDEVAKRTGKSKSHTSMVLRGKRVDEETLAAARELGVIA